MKTTDKKTRYNWRPFEEARTLARSLGFKNQSEWRKWAKGASRPSNIPAFPQGVYKNTGWLGWGDWLGTKNRKGGYLSFDEACAFVHTLELKNKDEWSNWAKSDERPDNIPSNPAGVYKQKGLAKLGRLAWYRAHCKSK